MQLFYKLLDTLNELAIPIAYAAFGGLARVLNKRTRTIKLAYLASSLVLSIAAGLFVFHLLDLKDSFKGRAFLLAAGYASHAVLEYAERLIVGRFGKGEVK